MVHAQMMMMMMMMSDDVVVNNCFAEPVGLGECSIGMDLNSTQGSYFTARFGIPNKIKNKNNDDNTTTAEEDAEGGGQRVKDCRYAWQVIANEVEGDYTFLYTTVTGSQLTPSDPNCTVDCSAVISSQPGFVFTEPSTMTIRHRFYILPILEGQNVNMKWNPFPQSPSLNLPPPFSTFQITAYGVCSLEEWEPMPTSTPSITPQPTTNPLDSSGSAFGSAMSPSSLSWSTGLMVALVFGVAVW
jgi:hypothetical protein